MSDYRICQNCGKGITVSHESDEPICGVCFFGFNNVDESSIEKLIEKETDKLSVEKLQSDNEILRKGLEDIIFFSHGCYLPEYFANIAKKAIEQAQHAREGSGDEW